MVMLKRDEGIKRSLEDYCKELQRHVNSYQGLLEEAQVRLRRLDGTYECSVCGTEFLLHKPNSNAIHGAVFTPLEFEPPIWQGKVIDAICAVCLKKILLGAFYATTG